LRTQRSTVGRVAPTASAASRNVRIDRVARAGVGSAVSKKEERMHARLTRFEGTPERIDDAVRQTEEVWVPRLREIDGFGGVVSLADRSNGTVVAITYWESEEAMRASQEKVTGVRKDAADAMGARSQPVVEHYEVVFEAR
jgi:heme-degrading monooxygenase HmoA